MQKNKKSTQRLKVSLHGMNDRMLIMMTRFIELNCKDVADVVEEDESNVEIIDYDMVESESILEQRLAQQPLKPIIALSLQEISVKHVLFVKKPIDSNNVVNALRVVKRQLQKKKVSLQKSSIVEVKEGPEHKLEQVLEKKEINNNSRSSYLSELGRLQKERMRQKESATKAFSSPDSGNFPEKKVDAGSKGIDESAEISPIVEENKDSGKPENIAPPQQKEVIVAKELGRANVVSAASSRALEKNIKTAETKGGHELKSSQPQEYDTPPQAKETQLAEPVLNAKPDKSFKNDLPVKENKTIEPKNEVESSSVHNEEIDQLLKELSSVPSKPSAPEPKNEEVKQKDNRNFVRYAFHPLEAQLKKNTFTTITVLLLNTSSRGALIELRKPAKLRGKVKLIIEYDAQHLFEIPARVMRREGKNRYGLQFLENQHELTDYLVNSGRSFHFA